MRINIIMPYQIAISLTPVLTEPVNDVIANQVF
jgi:hypothetical protein